MKFYFPNFIIKLVRSNLPPHQHVFHAPLFLNKLDLKSIISNMYGVVVKDVRTMVLSGKRPKLVHGKKKGGRPSFKKVIVTTNKDFLFPPPPTVLENGAIAIPPQTGKGRNSANHNRLAVLRQAREREPEA